MSGELKHASVGTSMTQAEFEATTTHTLDGITNGDVLYSDGTYIKRLAKGTDGDFLSSGTPPVWINHAADIDAHMTDWLQVSRTGNYFLPFPYREATTRALAADRIYAVPFIVVRNLTIDRLAIEVTTGAAGKVARLGIYQDGTNCYPGILVGDYGTVSLTNVAVVTVIFSQALTKGLYWIALATDGTATIRMHRCVWSPGGWEASNLLTGNDYSHWFKNAVGAGALADPFVADAVQNINEYPAILPRLLSLD